MKKTMLAVLATALFSGSAFAAMEGSQAAGAQLTYFSPAGGDLSDGAEAALGFGIHYTRQIQDEWSGLGELDYVKFGSKKISGLDVTFTSTIIGLSAKYAFQEMNGFMPHGLVGLQVASDKGEVSGTLPFIGAVSASETKTRFGVQVGVGAEKSINDMWNVGADLRYRTFGSDGSAISLGLNATYKFGK